MRTALDRGNTEEWLVQRAIDMSGLMTATGQEAAFILDALQRVEYLTEAALRMHGEPLPPHQVREYGMRANAKVSRRLVELLKDGARDDVRGAAHVIAFTVEQERHTIRQLAQLVDGLGPRVSVALTPSRMTAGPCEIARDFASRTMSAIEAPLLPLDGCDRLGQCGCRYGLR